MLPRQLADVDEAVHSAEIDERTERDHRRHGALSNLSDLEIGEEAVASLLLVLFEVGPAGQHNVVAVLVELNDLGLHDGADVRLQVTHTAQFNQRGREEPAKPDVDDKSALHDLNDRAFNDSLCFFLGFDVAPSSLVLSTLLRQNQTTFFVFLGEHEGFDGLSHRHHFCRIHIVANAELTRWDDAFALVSDVEQNLVSVNLHDDAAHQLPIVDFGDPSDRLGEVGVVIYDLTGCVCSLVIERSHCGVDDWGARGVGQGSVLLSGILIKELTAGMQCVAKAISGLCASHPTGNKKKFG